MKSEVYNMDCIEYMRTLPDKAFQLAIADPPYGGAGNEKLDGGGGSVNASTGTRQAYQIGQHQCQGPHVSLSENIQRNLGGCNHATGGRFERYEGNAGVKCIDWDIAPKQEFFDELLRVAERVIIWGGNYFALPPSRCFIIWDKKQPEEFSMAMCEYAWTNMDGNAKMFRMQPQGNQKAPRFHPTQKPIELYSWLLQKYAKTGDNVFDPMMGSQSSRIAANRLGFDYVGCEIDKEYFDKGCERFEKQCHGIIKMNNGDTITQTQLEF